MVLVLLYTRFCIPDVVSVYMVAGCLLGGCTLAIYEPMIYTAPYVPVMLLMQANPLRGQVGGGWAL
jgi:hypothetical protein